MAPSRFQTHNAMTSPKQQSSWRSRTLYRLQDALPKLKRLVSRKTKKGRRALLNLFESQRRDLIDGLRNEDTTSTDHDKVTNLQALLSLPLELEDLESCLEMGVAGALEASSTDSTDRGSHTHPLNLSEIDADAQFLAHFVVGGGNSTDLATNSSASQAAELLETLRQPQPSVPTGGMAQLTALVLIIAQILIGAQMLRRHRKRINPIKTNQQVTSDGTLSCKTPALGSSDQGLRRSDPGLRGRSRSPNASSHLNRSRTRSRSRSRCRFVEENAPLQRRRRRSRSRSFDLGGLEPPPLLAVAPSVNIGEQKSALDKHLSGSSRTSNSDRADDGQGTKIQSALDKHLSDISRTPNSDHADDGKGKNGKLPQEHDDNGTAETDSLSLSEGQPQNIKEDQREHDGPSVADANSNIADANDVRALLSFEGSTRHELELPPSFARDMFALRLAKLKSELTNVKQEQKNSLADSSQQIQLQYQETNKQYHDLTNRLANLTTSIIADPISAQPIKAAVEERAKSPLLRTPSPLLVEAQANMRANNQERAKLLRQVSTLQQDLKTQQERHYQDLQQREATLQQMNTKIQFLSHELERRVLHSRAMEEELNAKQKAEGQATQVNSEVQVLKQHQRQLALELQDTKAKFSEKERECQVLLQKLRQVSPPSSAKSSAENEVATEEHRELMKELEQQLAEQDEMNRKTLEMTQMLEVKRCELIERTKDMLHVSKELEERRLKVEAMESAAAASPLQSQATEELEKELAELQSVYETQSLECKKLNEIVISKSKLLQEKEAECHKLAGRLEEMTRELKEKEAQILQLEQDVQDKNDLAAQNEAISIELQVQHELQEKMNQTTLQMINLLEEKEQSNNDLTTKLDELNKELNRSKGSH